MDWGHVLSASASITTILGVWWRLRAADHATRREINTMRTNDMAHLDADMSWLKESHKELKEGILRVESKVDRHIESHIEAKHAR